MRFHLALLPLVAILVAGPAVAAPDPVESGAKVVGTLLGGGSATPNFFGATGLLLTPTAYTVGRGGLSAQAYGASDFSSFGATYGLFQNLEIGATYVDGRRHFDGGFVANAKYLLLRENTVLPAVSVGVIDAFDQLGVDPSWYVVASKDFHRLTPLPLRVHFGYGAGVYDNDLFAGAELHLTSPTDIVPVVHPSFSAIAEYEHRDVNVGLRARWRGFGATVGLFDFSRFGGGLTYTTHLGR